VLVRENSDCCEYPGRSRSILLFVVARRAVFFFQFDLRRFCIWPFGMSKMNDEAFKMSRCFLSE